MDKDPPIEPQSFLGGVKVIDFGDIRVSRGLSRRPFTTCTHKHLTYDPAERRVWCKDCERNIDNFDAFKAMVENFHTAYSAIERAREEVQEALNHNLHLIAAKNIEGAWRGKTMAIACPHCKIGLLPEDFYRLGGMCSAEIERQRRTKK